MRETPEYHIHISVHQCENESCANPIIHWTIFPPSPFPVVDAGVILECTNCKKQQRFRYAQAAHRTEISLQSGKSYTIRNWDNTDRTPSENS
jgi:hypothetical protein